MLSLQVSVLQVSVAVMKDHNVRVVLAGPNSFDFDKGAGLLVQHGEDSRGDPLREDHGSHIERRLIMEGTLDN